MNKKVMIGIGIIFFSALFVVLKIVIPSMTGSKELELTYKTNGGVPYKWEYKIEDESIVEFVKTKDITSESDKELTGGPVYINYIFKGLKEGKTTIIFKYINITDNSIEKEEKVEVKVDKYKNISLIANP
jgi:predicted secreted protein